MSGSVLEHDDCRDQAPDAAVDLPSGERWVRYGRRALGLVLCALGLVLIQQGRSLGYESRTGPGPGFFPVWVGVALALLSAAWFVTDLRSRSIAVPQDLATGGIKQVLRILAALAVLTLTFEPLGYNLSVLLFLLFLSFSAGWDNAAVKVLVAVAASVGVYLAFEHGLGINLPDSGLLFLRSLGL